VPNGNAGVEDKGGDAEGCFARLGVFPLCGLNSAVPADGRAANSSKAGRLLAVALDAANKSKYILFDDASLRDAPHESEKDNFHLSPAQQDCTRTIEEKNPQVFFSSEEGD
jgi:hypothetical protein